MQEDEDEEEEGNEKLYNYIDKISLFSHTYELRTGVLWDGESPLVT